MSQPIAKLLLKSIVGKLILCSILLSSAQVACSQFRRAETVHRQQTFYLRPSTETTDTRKTNAEKTSTKKTNTEKTTSPKQQRKIVYAAVYLLGGIIAIGLITIVGIILWGMRARKKNRNASSEATPHDPLWYLRNPPSPDDQDDNSSDQTTSPETNSSDENNST